MFKAKRVWTAILLSLAAISLPLTPASAMRAMWGISIPLCTARPVNRTVLDASRFPSPTRIDNSWLPLVPGTQLTLDGTTLSDGKPTGHRVVTTVTDVTKMIGKVRTLVIWDRDFQDGQLEEAELAFFAQDWQGNVWNLGEYPEQYGESGAFTGAPSTWIAGVAGAQAGVHMLAHPNPGFPRYSQGYSSPIKFYDCAQVFQINQKVSVPFGSYRNVLVTDENSPLDPAGGHQRKFQAPGVGLVQVTAVNDPEGETLALTRRVHLTPAQLLAADKEVARLDGHGRRPGVNAVYARTAPVRLP